jgi:curved DNA-binding protein CbpA
MPMRDAIRSWIEQQHADLERKSYYQLLGVASDASAPQIKSAYYKLAARLHPDLYGDLLDAETRQLLVSVYSRVVEASRVLGDGARRQQYDTQLTRGKLRWSAEEERTPVKDPETQIANPAARRLFRLGRTAAMSGDTKSAILNLKMALTTEPANPILKAELARIEAQIKKS